ncbi:MAG: Trk family potassium uptake protein, partial [Oscillospiraceae bacterium]|nr:Trk family potassium uptake protein [Oscillospiraceae bacterium]
MRKRKILLSPAQTIALCFVAVILVGALLLMMPFTSRSGVGLSFVDSLFTATSATCVTGLVVVDTWTHFNWLGQFILLVLIQVG